MLQAVTPQLLAAHATAGVPAVRQALLQCLRRLEGAAPAAALYPVLVEMRRNRDGDKYFSHYAWIVSSDVAQAGASKPLP